jgi:hypothetical protein
MGAKLTHALISNIGFAISIVLVVDLGANRWISESKSWVPTLLIQDAL